VTVLATQPVDELWLVPSVKHPFDKSLASFEDRMEMCRLAVQAASPAMKVSAIERELGTSRSFDTLTGLAARLPGTRFRLVIGADILADKDKWYRWDELMALAPPILLGRQGVVAPAAVGPLVQLPAISSTEIRAHLAARRPIDHLVPRAVAAFIRDHRLYAA
jgi:nicotinate-nucleotide adenylyltransferase